MLSYGNQIAVTDASDTTFGTVARLLKGRHLLEYKSIEHEADAYKETYTVADNDYEDFVNIELLPIKEQRKKKEEEHKAEEERWATAEKTRLEQEQRYNQDDKYKYDLFFCYSRQDASIVRLAYNYLRQAGYRCWIDMDDIASGMDFGHIIADSINKSKCLLFFHSIHSSKSAFAQHELDYAFTNGKKILPIKLDDNPISVEQQFLLADRFALNFDLQDRDNLVHLVDVVRKVLDE